ncbi:uncharacterized protein N7515_007826, partial [Penicillium bovifimosum]
GDLYLAAGEYQAGTLLKWDKISLFDWLLGGGSEPEMSGDLQVLASEFLADTLLTWDEMSLFDQSLGGVSEHEMSVLSWELSELHGSLVVVVAPGTANAWILLVVLAPNALWFGLIGRGCHTLLSFSKYPDGGLKEIPSPYPDITVGLRRENFNRYKSALYDLGHVAAPISCTTAMIFPYITLEVKGDAGYTGAQHQNRHNAAVMLFHLSQLSTRARGEEVIRQSFDNAVNCWRVQLGAQLGAEMVRVAMAPPPTLPLPLLLLEDQVKLTFDHRGIITDGGAEAERIAPPWPPAA